MRKLALLPLLAFALSCNDATVVQPEGDLPIAMSANHGRACYPLFVTIASFDFIPGSCTGPAEAPTCWWHSTYTGDLEASGPTVLTLDIKTPDDMPDGRYTHFWSGEAWWTLTDASIPGLEEDDVLHWAVELVVLGDENQTLRGGGSSKLIDINGEPRRGHLNGVSRGNDGGSPPTDTRGHICP